MQPFTIAALREQRAQTGNSYLEFLHVSSMSAGVYELGVGEEDKQQPHTEDELYYIVAGRAMLLVGDEDIPVTVGSMVFVPANVVHRFHAITDPMTIVVFFAPAEYTYRDAPPPQA
jgi:mannose-6-phosphate isomerase-like protein (cupin superfamily)